MAQNRRFRSVLEPQASPRGLHRPRRVYRLDAVMRWGWEGECEGAGLAPPRHAHGTPGSPEWLKTDAFGRFWSPKQAQGAFTDRGACTRSPQACAGAGRGSARGRAWRTLAMQIARLGAQNCSKPTFSAGFGAPSSLKRRPRTVAMHFARPECLKTDVSGRFSYANCMPGSPEWLKTDVFGRF